MSDEFLDEERINRWFDSLYEILDAQVELLKGDLAIHGFTVNSDNDNHTSFVKDTAEGRQLKVIIYKVAGRLGRGGTAVQELDHGSVVAQAVFNDFEHANLHKRVMALVAVSLPE